jgi:hypothetical protein
MTHSSPTAAHSGPQTRTSGTLFGVPVSDFGWFASILIGLASGFMAFFASTFCAIVFILIYNTAAHGSIDFALSYRRVGFPIGIVVMAVALTYLASLWFKRVLRRS